MIEPTVDQDKIDLLLWIANTACKRIFVAMTDGSVCPQLGEVVLNRIKIAAALGCGGEMAAGDATLRIMCEERRLVDAPPLEDPRPDGPSWSGYVLPFEPRG